MGGTSDVRHHDGVAQIYVAEARIHHPGVSGVVFSEALCHRGVIGQGVVWAIRHHAREMPANHVL